MLVVAITATLAFTWWLPDYRVSSTRASWQPPPEAMFASSMHEQPVPGWRINVADLGLPRTVDSGLAVSNDERRLRPLIGNVGTNAYFLARSGATENSQWWLAGLDVRDGRALFAAVPLGVLSSAPECFLNGPNEILCVTRFSPSASAWVIDARSGTVKFSGPTDLGALVIEQLGMYAVARKQNEGVYGIGPQAETTWFVPGDGLVSKVDSSRPAASAQTLTAQLEANPRTYIFTVFSVTDGEVIEPEIEEGYTLGKPAFYTGGFAAEVNDPDGIPSEIAFFDETGKRLGEYDGPGNPGNSPADLPVVGPNSDDRNTVFTIQGQPLIEVPGGTLYLVGTTLMVDGGNSLAFPELQLYNMRDGTAAGPICDYPMHNYLGTDGSTLVFEVTNRNAELLAKAHDLHSCERLWTLPKEPDSLDRIWNIDGTLVQLANEGTELRSLVAPN
ncbi:Uncharacterised protein [Mycolicibacterium vanbaalenii]|uniref:Uncharacterized protein n=1 Tax=Mycolicibacterium vanbaalenii TaxID=110539 RepID=A0A5S9RBF8_MYCVN|nr:Uncharacterised protein [Mycolicibacterium vanbaalenii]